MGTYRISVRATDSTNIDTSTRKKYSDLSTSNAYIKREYANDGDYSSNYADISAYKSGSDIYVTTRLVDAHVARSGSGSGYGGAWSWTGADTVPGTSTVNVSSLKLSNASGSVSLTNPTFSVTNTL
jgi:cephalosporin hydroxylase